MITSKPTDNPAWQWANRLTFPRHLAIRLMRERGVTIRQVAAAMAIPLKRVRELRDRGTAGLTALDFIDGIHMASAVRNLENSAALAS